MPRLVPRLLQRLQAPPSKQPIVFDRPRPKIRQRPGPSPPCPPLSPQGRTQSIILDSLHPIMAISKSRRHKEPYAPLRINSALQKHTRNQVREWHPVQVMSEQERTLWASPYLRMLATTVRLSAVGNRHMPSAFLLRFSAKRMPSGPVVVVPDALEHPKFRQAQRPGTGHYVICRKDAIAVMRDRHTWRRVYPTAQPHPKLEEQIGHLLRVRILQELHLLLQTLRRKPCGDGDADTPLLRRLTRAEWGALRESGTIPQEDAIAVIVVPPLNRDHVTRERPEPSMSSLPPTTPAPTQTRPLPPISTLMPTTSDWFDGQLSTILPQAKVPLYNGLALFPRPEQRASCYKLLTAILDTERRARQHAKAKDREDPDDESRHAFLLRSNAATLLRADTVPLAIALWRLRLWEGQGWDLGGSTEYVGPWADR
ncbi:hypothetical protein FOMPIDRAFT_1159826 [Fomitopsis schrenkii]|uniref:Uncharacterized protein n=1 Tax=Fomitopsis schrenkii TaxID=2126942 RepID=S8EHN6_FOMSC|nr:hypothetical protein FOMPIDRAFT_1159826 [Fomitopsis schrenkii]